jgi:serine protease Do
MRQSTISAFVITVVVAGGAGVAPIGAQPRLPPRVDPGMMLLFGPGSQIGVSVRDLEERDGRADGGVFIEDVRVGSPAEKAGIRRSDIVTRFDDEPVRSVRQFRRLVDETPAGRTVKATIVRDGQANDVSITPEARHGLELSEDIRERVLGSVRGRAARDADRVRASAARSPLGVSVQTLTPQLAAYFGAKAGALVSAVADGSAAARAGLRAGDVITAIGGNAVESASDVLRHQRAGPTEPVAVEIVRDKKVMTVTVNR